ncbi:bacteriophage antitermination protein Q [Klebsiella oxytoca]|nr:antitermination protein [Klebsiella oxytoca]
MNAQQLEYIRIKLRQALVDDSGNTKGQLEAFAEHPPTDKNRNPRKRIHVVELDNGRGGVRRVKAENTALYVPETRSRRRPMPPIREGAFTSCSWRRAILTLNASQQAWLKYCYGFDLHFGYQTEICRYVWDTYAKRITQDKLQRRVKKRLITLVWLAVQDVAAKNLNEAYKEYAATALASFMSVNRDSWYKTYAKHWREIKEIVRMLDTNSLAAVGREKLISFDYDAY